jgi:hypothetical protein
MTMNAHSGFARCTAVVARALAAIALTTVVTPAAWSASKAPVAHDPHLILLEQQAAARHAAAAEHARDGVIDTTPPVLTAFKVNSHVNVRKTGEQAVFDISATDDMVGVRNIQVRLTGPSGQQVWTNFNVGGAPQRKLAHRYGHTFDPATEPGTWTVDFLYIHDWNGNIAFYDGDALAALGNNVVTVANKTADTVAPSLVSGKILTPAVSASTPPKGMGPGNGPFVRVALKLRDDGGQIASGLRDAYAYYCLPSDVGGCSYGFYLYGESSVWGESKQTIEVGSEVWSGQPPGVYKPYYISVSDLAGNVRTYISSEFGGETDFSQYFSSTTIEVMP